MNHSGVPLTKINPRFHEQIVAALHPQTKQSATLRPEVTPDHAQPYPDRPLPRTVLECPAGNEPLATAQAQGLDTRRYRVRVISYRRRLLDEDNLGAKYFVDGLRYAGLIPADSPDRCAIRVSQRPVKTKAEEKTVIHIEWP